MSFARRLLAALLLLAPAASAIAAPGYGARLEGFDYPHPVRMFRTTAQGQPVEIAYMDVRPKRANGRTVVLLHGKNFCGATWGEAATALSGQGYRVLVLDQLGFCKSSKPAGFQYSLHGVVTAQMRLIDSLGLDRFVLVGHSMGGMVATRWALLHPLRIERLVLVNPLGLADRLAEGVPYADVDLLTEEERATNEASIKAYQLRTYYHGQWRPAYDRWVAMLAGMYAGPGRTTVVAAQARASEMIETQPVAYEFGRLEMPTALMVGMLDTTAFGRQRAPLAIRDSIPSIPALARNVVGRIPQGQLIAFDDLGHAPQVEAPARFNAALLRLLDAPDRRR